MRITGQPRRMLVHMHDWIHNAGLEKRLFVVASHERSGTHLLINTLCAKLPLRVGYGCGTLAGRGYHNLGEWFGPYEDKTRRFDAQRGFRESLNRKGAARNSIVKTHMDHPCFQASDCADLPVIYIHRDPRDVLVSFYHYLQQDAFYDFNPTVPDHRFASVSDFLRAAISEFLAYGYSLEGDFQNVCGRWASHVKGWASAGQTLLVTYEELCLHPEAVVEKVAAHLNLHSRRIPSIGFSPKQTILPRQKTIGNWREWMTGEDVSFVRTEIEKIGLIWEDWIHP